MATINELRAKSQAWDEYTILQNQMSKMREAGNQDTPEYREATELSAKWKGIWDEEAKRADIPPVTEECKSLIERSKKAMAGYKQCNFRKVKEDGAVRLKDKLKQINV